MSSTIPPDGSPEPEYLEQASGARIGTDSPGPRSRRTVLMAGGAAAGLLLLGGGDLGCCLVLRAGSAAR